MESTAVIKDLWRQRLRSQRSALTAAQRRHLSLQACQRLTSHPEVLEASRLALYVPRSSELDCLPALKLLWRRGQECFLPRVVGNTLEFSPCHDLADLRPGAFGIPEPQSKAASLDSIYVMIVPGLGFDRSGNRLGYGKGYYDKALCGFGGVSFGMAYSCCVVDKLPRETHDWPVQWLVTETGCWRVRS